MGNKFDNVKACRVKPALVREKQVKGVSIQDVTGHKFARERGSGRKAEGPRPNCKNLPMGKNLIARGE